MALFERCKKSKKEALMGLTSAVDKNLIQREDEWPALAPDLDDIKFLSTCFHDVEFSYVFRENNIRADSLTKGGRSRGHCFTVVDVLVHSRQAIIAGLNVPE